MIPARTAVLSTPVGDNGVPALAPSAGGNDPGKSSEMNGSVWESTSDSLMDRSSSAS